MTYQERLRKLWDEGKLRDGTKVEIDDGVYTFEADSWFFGCLRGKTTLSPAFLSNTEYDGKLEVVP